MGKFITIKQVHAYPMSAIEARHKGYQAGDCEDTQEGYEVVYPDGYKSWCPKEVFDDNSVCTTVDEYSADTASVADDCPDYIKRVVNEHNELVDKYNKLKCFIKTDKFIALSVEEKRRLIIQRNVMEAYISILEERIESVID